MAKIEIDSIPTAAQRQPLSESAMFCQNVNMGHTPVTIFPNVGPGDMAESFMKPPKPVQILIESQDQEHESTELHRDADTVIIPDSIMTEGSDEISPNDHEVGLSTVHKLGIHDDSMAGDGEVQFDLGAAIQENFYGDPLEIGESRNDILTVLQTQLDQLDPFDFEGGSDVRYKPFYDYDGDVPSSSTGCNSLATSRAGLVQNEEEGDLVPPPAIANSVDKVNPEELSVFEKHVQSESENDSEIESGSEKASEEGDLGSSYYDRYETSVLPQLKSRQNAPRENLEGSTFGLSSFFQKAKVPSEIELDELGMNSSEDEDSRKRVLQTSWMEFVVDEDGGDHADEGVITIDTEKQPVPTTSHIVLTASDDGYEGSKNGTDGEFVDQADDNGEEARMSTYHQASSGSGSIDRLSRPTFTAASVGGSGIIPSTNIFNNQSGKMISVASESLSERDRAAMEDHDRAWADNDFDDFGIKESEHFTSQSKPVVSKATKTFLTHQSNRRSDLGRETHISDRLIEKAGISALPRGGKTKIELQQAKWLVRPEEITINPDYIPVPSNSYDSFDENRPESEKSLLSTVVVKLTGSFEVRLFGGMDWAPKSTTEKADKNKVSDKVDKSSKHSLGGNKRSVQFSSDDMAIPSSNSRRNYTMHSWERRKDQDMIALATKDVYLCMRIYRPENRGGRSRGAATSGMTFMVDSQLADKSDSATNLKDHLPASTEGLQLSAEQRHFLQPAQRVVFVAKQLVLSFGKAGAPRKKVIGLWTTPHRPMALHKPMIQIAFVGYHTVDKSAGPLPVPGEAVSVDEEEYLDIEHRMYVQLQPIVSYLDENVVQFLKKLGESLALSAPAPLPVPQTVLVSDTKKQPSSSLYFQYVSIAPIQLRVSYTASIIDVVSLHKGDYTQLLNIFPLNGLELTLAQVKSAGVTGIGEVIGHVCKAWVEDIYANQMMRVLSGTAALKGISHIGHDLKDLLFVPLKDYKKTGGLAKNFMKCSSQLLRTVVSESLQPIQYITKFLADAISDLVSEDSQAFMNAKAGTQETVNSMRKDASHLSRNHMHHKKSTTEGIPIRAGNLGEGLNLAYGSISREMGAAAELVIAVPVREYEKGGARGSAKSLVRALPVAVLRPIAGMSEGISYTIMGLRNNIDPTVKHESGDLYEVNIWDDGPHRPPALNRARPASSSSDRAVDRSQRFHPEGGHKQSSTKVLHQKGK